MSTGHAAERRAAIRFERVDIVFGDRPERALALLDAGASREEILARTGQVVGVAGATLAVGEGEICVLMGLSGSGKSTLLRAVNRLNPVTRGRVLVRDGETDVDVGRCDAATLRRLRMRRIAMVFQQFALLPWRTVAENVAFGLELRGVPRQERERVVREKLALVHLEAWADKRVSQLSGGMQQRVGLARALATDADILLMDEPFSALDPLIRHRLQDELLELQHRLGKTILFVSHDLDEALKLGSTIAILEGGRIVQTGRPEDIVLAPADDYVRSFVANVNPLNVLSLRATMRPIDPSPGRIGLEDGLRVETDAEGRLVAACRGERPLAVVDDPARLVEGSGAVLAASDRASVRLAIEALAKTHLPLLVIDAERRLLGSVGVREVLAALGRRPVSST
ncbi:Glycine betaine transport ATP-binding protein OpuAA [bacterium HR40]|nr:Glycine betaine transport ATP-binding protein OpuAA [bacterium HR40]